MIYTTKFMEKHWEGRRGDGLMEIGCIPSTNKTVATI